jgi:hypothetical protein
MDERTGAFAVDYSIDLNVFLPRSLDREELGSAGVVDDHPPRSTTGAVPCRTEPVVSTRLRKSTPPGPGCHDERWVALVSIK